MSNTVTITGNLGQDPELRFIASGKAVATISVGDTPRRFNKDTNQWEDSGDTLWLRCSLWGDAAESLAEQAKRGDKVIVTGRLKQRSWDDKDGTKRTVIECDADSVGVVGKRAQRSGQVHQGAAAADPWATAQPAQGGGWGNAAPALDTEPPFAFPPNSPVN